MVLLLQVVVVKSLPPCRCRVRYRVRRSHLVVVVLLVVVVALGASGARSVRTGLRVLLIP